MLPLYYGYVEECPWVQEIDGEGFKGEESRSCTECSRGLKDRNCVGVCVCRQKEKANEPKC